MFKRFCEVQWEILGLIPNDWLVQEWTQLELHNSLNTCWIKTAIISHVSLDLLGPFWLFLVMMFHVFSIPWKLRPKPSDNSAYSQLILAICELSWALGQTSSHAFNVQCGSLTAWCLGSWESSHGQAFQEAQGLTQCDPGRPGYHLTTMCCSTTKSYPPYIQGKENQTLHLMWKATWAQKEEKDQWWPALENTSWNIFPCAVRSEGIFLDSFIVLTFLNFIFSCGHKGESFGVGNNR